MSVRYLKAEETVYVLEHFTRSGGRVLRLRNEHRFEELINMAETGDTVYTVPDSVCHSADKLVKYLTGRTGLTI